MRPSLAVPVALAALALTACAPAHDATEHTAQAAEDLIYGADHRREPYELGDPVSRHLAEATAALFDRSQLSAISGGYGLDVSGSFGSAYGLCADEPYRNQPSSAFCTGFLVAPDLMVTAGHCIDSRSCSSVRFVFGFHMIDADTVTGAVPTSDVYSCAEVLGRAETSTDDWAVVRLDRASARSPLAVRRSGTIATGAGVIVAGHPAGLPLKIAGGATVRENGQPYYFGANVDTYGGNSGSPVVATDGTVEGILVRGNADFDYDSGARCYRSNVCADSGCPGFEGVTRASRFVDLVPQDNGGGDPDPLCDAASCDDGDPCTVDVCDPALGCSNTPLACGADETCVAGVCEAIPACLPRGEACGSSSECCSGRCHRRRGCR